MERERALEIVKKHYSPDGVDDTLRRALEALIPELTESEDEKIRKFLVRIVNLCPDGSINIIGEVKKADVLAYLEKQKESFHIPETCKENADSFTDKDERIRKAVLEVVSDIDGGWPFEKHRITKKEAIAYLEKQKEPHFTKRNALFDKCVENCDPAVMKKVSDEVDEMLQKEQKPSINIDQLKSLMLQYLQEAANEKDDSDIEADTDKWTRKILGYNFEQKPAEWSEEDKKLIDDVINSLCCYQNTLSDYQKEIVGEEIRKLKSLSPQYHGDVTMTEAYKMGLEAGKASSWKPSEEQMDRLVSIVAALRKDCCDDMADFLAEIYHELEKL